LDTGFPQNVILRPPFIDPTISNGGNPLAVAKNGLTLPRYQNWSLTVERQLTNNMRLDVSYIANRGTRLNDHWRRTGLDANMNNPSVLALGSATLGSTCDGVTCPGGVTIPYGGFTGDVAQALRKYPQYNNIVWRGVPLGASLYNALEVVLEQRYSHGLGFRVGYTYSHLVNNGAESAQGDNGINGDSIQNPIATSEWGVSADDTPHVFLVGFTWELPFGKSMSSSAGRYLLGGWNLSGALRYESGRPLNIFMNNDLGNLLFNGQKRPNRAKGVSPVKGGSNPLVTGYSYFNAAAWTDPGPLAFGNAPRRDGSARSFPTYNEDLNLFKVFQIKERLNLRFETQFGNIFNRTDFCDPNTNFSAGSGFGQVSTQCNQPRSIQFALKLNY
jgi:hypothetical protein